LPKDKTDTLHRIIRCAKKEFLEKGFEKTSMRAIAAEAGITAAGLYRHFRDKEAMFASLVEPAANGLKQLYVAAHTDFEALPGDVQREMVFDYSVGRTTPFIDYIYDHFDAFKLLITCAEGTRFAGFIDTLVNIEVASTLKFIETTENRALASGKVTPELMHIVSNAFLSAIFEVVRHDMPKEDAEGYVESLRQFFTAGWKELLSR
jgi:TetR/AcrR family transcriptional regulator